MKALSLARNSTLAASCCLALAPGVCRQAPAANLVWSNAAGGLASTPGNWNPVQMPGAGDQLFFSLNNAYTITFNSGVTQSLLQSYSAGTVTIDLDASHTTVNLRIADNPGNTATVVLPFGNFTSDLVRLGDDTTSTGTLTVSGQFTDLNATTTIIGDDGFGTLEVLGAATLDTATFQLGRTATATGIATVSGVGQFGLNSSLSATTGVIADAGLGQLDVFAGGQASFDTLLIGAQDNSIGILNVESGTANNSSANVQGDLHLSHNAAATPAGASYLIVGNNGVVTVDGTTFLGDPNGGDPGTITLDGDGQFTTGSLVWHSVFHNLDMNSGTLIIDGGVLDGPSNSLFIDTASTGTPLLELRNGASIVNESGGGTQMLIGQADVRLNSDATANIGSIVIGHDLGDDGDLFVEDGASSATSFIVIGNNGEGGMEVGPGGTVTTNDIILGVHNPSHGYLEVSGTNAHVTTGELQVGGDGSLTEGTALVTILSGGLLDVTQTGTNTTIRPNGTVSVSTGAKLDSAGSIAIHGELAMFGGEVEANSITIFGEINGPGLIDANVGFNNSGARVINADNGSLTLGRSTDNNGYNGSLGTLNVGDVTVELRDANGAGLGLTTINGGTLDLPNDSVLLDNISNSIFLSGRGTITGGSWTNTSTITSTGTGLNIDNELTSNNQVINGELITFSSDGEFIGSGIVDCRVITQTGSSIDATGNLTMGDPTNTVGVTLAGTLDVGSHTVTLLDSNFVPLGTLTTLSGGTLVTPVQAILGAPGDVLSGAGTIQSALANNGGIIRPGGVNSIGTITVTGAFTCGVPPTLLGELNMELASLASMDRVVCNGSATLDGDLVVTPINGFVPVLNQEFLVLTASSISGSFDNVQLLNTPGLAAQAIVTATQVRVRIIEAPCPTDSNGDGLTNVNDMLAVINAWGPCVGCPADVNGDGVVNVNDLLQVINAWGTCP